MRTIIDRWIVIAVIYLAGYGSPLRVGDRFFLDDSIASELEEWEVKWLRDAVRRGRGYVSKGDDDDWEAFANSIKQQQNSKRPPSPAHHQAIPAAEQQPAFLGSFDLGGPPPVLSIGPPAGAVAAATFPRPPGGRGGVLNVQPDASSSGGFFFGNADPNQFMQPVVVQPQQAPPPSVPRPKPVSRRIGTPPPPAPAAPIQVPPEPSSRAEQELPSDEEIGGTEFKALANILNHLISRRQKELAADGGEQLQQQPLQQATTTTPRPKRRRTLRPLSNIILGPPEGGEDRRKGWTTTSTQPPTLPGHRPGEWVMMNPAEGDPEGEDRRVPDQLPVPTLQQLQPDPGLFELQQLEGEQQQLLHRDEVDERSRSIDNLPLDAEEEQFRLLSSQLADLVQRMKGKKKREPAGVKKKPAKPRVILIRNGTAEGLANRQYSLVATVTLIRDGSKNILVDTGLATDINGRTEMLRRLESLGVPAPSVHIVVSTHGHPDHAGNTHVFPDAVHYHGWYVHERAVFNLSNLFDSDREQLTPSVALLRTPGHTSEDIAVLVRDAVDEWGGPLGNVAVAGDVFVRREDVENDREWVPLSADVKAQALSRRTLLCKSDTIVPGHGPLFRVDRQLRAHFKC